MSVYWESLKVATQPVPLIQDVVSKTSVKSRLPKNLNLIIIGGGIGGMQTAITAAERGHKVTIWEKK